MESDSGEVTNPNLLIGMPIEKAKDLYGRSGWIILPVNIDGREKPHTQIIMRNRIKVEVAKGLIAKVRGNG